LLKDDSVLPVIRVSVYSEEELAAPIRYLRAKKRYSFTSSLR
jgi:hypothetical protein